MPNSQNKTAAQDREILLYFWHATLAHKKGLALSVLIPFATLCLNTLMPFFTGKLLAALSVNIDQASHYLPYLIVVGIVGVLANRYGTIALFRLQARVIADLQLLCMDNLLYQSTGFHNNRVAGKLVSDAIEFPQAYSILSSSFLVQIIPLAITIVTGVFLVGIKSWLLGLVLLGMAATVVGMTIVQSNRRRPLRARRLVASKAVTAHLADTIVNNQTVKTFAREEAESLRQRELNNTLRDIRISDWTGGAKAGSNRMAGLLLFQILFAFIIIHVVKQDRSLLATGIFAFSYSITISNNLFSINNLIRQVEDALVQATPIFEVLQHTPAVQDNQNARTLHVSKGAIGFNRVDFSYDDSAADDGVFKELDLHIKPGEKVGLVGPSGGGKSTLTRLLLRFNNIQTGSISIDDQNIADVTQASLREAIAYVPQEPLMFHRSVFENIAYGKTDATEEEVVAAAKRANAHDFIAKLSDGYNTLVGERGVKLSGGQRQRVAIARAILKDAPILVLDEATSALDSESERLIQDSLQSLMAHRTAIVVAHRLSTIQKMDRIVVMEDGQVHEQGTHAELLKKNGTYAKLWAHQSGGFIEE
ncbi:MAG TPA: ABC transporter ATP-binding protein [Candidatus Saccharimonadales bacterium]|jgi:ATP-binding cassette subfamily B protein